MLQPYTSSFGKFGVQGQYLDGESNFVDYSLAGAVSVAEQFKIVHCIMRSVTIFVMDSFFGHKFASKVLCHHVAVFKDRVLFSSYKGRNSNVYVAAFFNVAAYVSAIKAIKGSFFYSFVPTVGGAVFLLLVNSSAWFSAFFKSFSAVYAGESVSPIRIFFAAGSRAYARAVHRVAIEFSSVLVQIGLLNAKGLAAVSARESSDYASWRGNILVKSERTSTCQAAKSSFVARKVEEGFAAVFASFLNRHGFSPVCDNAGSLVVAVGIVK